MTLYEDVNGGRRRHFKTPRRRLTTFDGTDAFFENHASGEVISCIESGSGFENHAKVEVISLPTVGDENHESV